VLVAAALAVSAAAENAPFEVVVIPSRGRTVAADLVDLNGDGRTDLLQVVFIGIPPDDQRLIRVYFQTPAKTLPLLADFEIPLPPGSAAYDLADLRPAPGHELVLVRASDVLILSLRGPKAESWRIPVPGAQTAWPAQDDRGFERIRLVRSELGPEPLLLVPQLGSLAVLSADGTLRAQLEVGGRANYLVPAQPSLLFIESDLELFFDGPRLSIADVDGDSRPDVVSTTRHEVRLFLQRDGGFSGKPDRAYPLRIMSERSHVRGSGGVAVQASDLNGDGRADLLISHLTGGLTDARLEAALHLNRDGTWDLARPDAKLESKAALGSDVLLDVDGDGRVELLRTSIPFGVLRLIEALLTRSVGVGFSLYRFGDDSFSREPWVSKTVDFTLSFDTFRPRGFLPAWHLDLNGDGHLDLLTSGGGREIEVFLGGPERRYKKRDARQSTDTEGLLRAGDLDGDGLPDLVLFDPINSGAPVRVLHNRGNLPGTAPSVRAAPEGEP
jgi:hypothetical protein